MEKNLTNFEMNQMMHNKQYHRKELLSNLSFEWSHWRISPTDSKVRATFVQHNNQYHSIILLSGFHLNGHTLGFHPQTKRVKPPYTA